MRVAWFLPTSGDPGQAGTVTEPESQRGLIRDDVAVGANVAALDAHGGRSRTAPAARIEQSGGGTERPTVGDRTNHSNGTLRRRHSSKG